MTADTCDRCLLALGRTIRRLASVRALLDCLLLRCVQSFDHTLFVGTGGGNTGRPTATTALTDGRDLGIAIALTLDRYSKLSLDQTANEARTWFRPSNYRRWVGVSTTLEATSSPVPAVIVESVASLWTVTGSSTVGTYALTEKNRNNLADPRKFFSSTFSS